MQEVIEKLQSSGRSMQFQTEIDGLVHDIFEENSNNPFCPDSQPDEYDQHETEVLYRASSLNNQGLDAQLRYISETGNTHRAQTIADSLLTS